LTFWESGNQKIKSGARGILDIGAPSLAVIVNVGRETATPEDMFEAVDGVISKLTSLPEAVGSRFGLILISYTLKQIPKVTASIEKVNENKGIIRGIFELLTPKVKEIYHNQKIINWLEEPLDDYTKDVSALAKNFPEELMFGKNAKIFCIDHGKGAYRHMKGAALESTIVDLGHEILFNRITDKLTKKILSKAKEELEKVKAVNIDSIRTMIKISEESGKVLKEILTRKYESLKGYKKALVFAYTYYISNHEDLQDKRILFNEINAEFSRIDYEKRKELFGGYSSFNRIIGAMEKLNPDSKRKLQADLEILFDLELRYSPKENQWTIKNRGKTILDLIPHIKKLVGTEEEKVVEPLLQMEEYDKKLKDLKDSFGRLNAFI